ESVLDSECSSLDEEHVFIEGGRNRQPGESLDELRQIRRVDVGVGRLVQCDVGQLLAKLRRVQARVVVSDGTGGEVGEEIEDGASALGIKDPGTFRFPEIHDNVVAVCQHVPGQHVVHFTRLNDQTAIGD